ncbi:2OG-Fe dioxygenase family protein [Streptomyces sp. Je 1-369]|uniref:2OG-Fe dioxygenase family protein n=1 Tax=Streptomyces sp. Je 1-369 TaxID=2966192 RepID=UPI002286C2CF|nr:2OG-Fe dioxygenase family protein [Streptomyces sp. Je 1-369]WAL98780.1 2OG-Fe dioxygenase family protein [Streptomyces sp. Je 1-369]
MDDIRSAQSPATAPAPTDSTPTRPARTAQDTLGASLGASAPASPVGSTSVRRDGYARLSAADLGVDTQALAEDFAQLAKGYEDLPPDPYAPDTNRYRRYSHAVYLPWSGELSFVPGAPDPEFGTVTKYWQDEHNPEFPRVLRRLPDIPPALQGNRLLDALIHADLDQALWLQDLQHTPVYIGVHMITLAVRGRQQVAVSSPNCLHQDGGSAATFTFAHLIGCHNINGGENAIATADSAGQRPDTLPPHAVHARFMMTEPLDGYGVHDHRVSHYVAPVHLAHGKNTGRRDILIIGIAPYTPGL